MAFKEAKEVMGETLRFTAQPDSQSQAEKTIFLGEVIEGYYVGKKEDVGKYNSNIYEILLTMPGQQGRLVGIWGSALLDGKFAEIPLESMVRVSFKGFTQPKNGQNKPYATFLVEYDKDMKRPASFVQAAAPAAGGVAAAPAQPTADQQFDAIGKQDATPGAGY